jgi:hypothetical protein
LTPQRVHHTLWSEMWEDFRRAPRIWGKAVTRAVHFSGTMMPTGAEGDGDVTIHTRLPITAYVARQKAHVYLALRGRQSFCVDEPIL